ncbi:MAG: tetratricopeptide repeat protein [Chitinophagales bacterium]|nr:tetratricopeptide repeat protein [Chitinophagales bacterium]
MKKYLFALCLCSLSVVYCAAQTTAKEWFDKGISLKKDTKYKEAIDAFKKSVALQSSYSEAWHQLGWCYNELGQYNDAITALKKEELNNPKDKASTNFEMGYAYEGLKKFDEAITRFSNTIDLDDEYGSAYKERGYCYFKKKDYEKALSDFNEYTTLTENIEDADFYYRKGWCENEVGEYDNAIESLKNCVAIDDTYSDAFSELGYAYNQLNKNDEAIANYRTAMNLDKGTDSRSILGIADVYYDKLKNYDSATVYYEKGLQLQKDNKTAYYKLGWCYNDKEEYANAISPLKQALALDPDYNEAKTELGFANYKLGRYDDALDLFRQIRNKNSKDELSRYYAGFCYYYKNDQLNLQQMITQLTNLNTTQSLKYAETLKKYIK